MLYQIYISLLADVPGHDVKITIVFLFVFVFYSFLLLFVMF